MNSPGRKKLDLLPIGWAGDPVRVRLVHCMAWGTRWRDALRARTYLLKLTNRTVNRLHRSSLHPRGFMTLVIRRRASVAISGRAMARCTTCKIVAGDENDSSPATSHSIQLSPGLVRHDGRCHAYCSWQRPRSINSRRTAPRRHCNTHCPATGIAHTDRCLRPPRPGWSARLRWGLFQSCRSSPRHWRSPPYC